MLLETNFSLTTLLLVRSLAQTQLKHWTQITRAIEDLAFSIINSLSYFVENKDEKENPVKFVKNVETHVNSDEYPTVAKAKQVLRSHFQTHLREKVLEWYCDLPADTRSN